MRAQNLALSLGLVSLVLATPGSAHDSHHHHHRHAKPAAAPSQHSASGAMHEGHHNHQHHSGPAAAPARLPQSAEIQLHDVTLRNQTGAPVRFRSDVVGDRIVVMDFIYTSCTTVCPLASALFAEIQQQLGDRLGREVLLLSLSIDPITDTPARLRDYAARFDAKPGWIWLTGDKTDMERVLRGLGTYTPDITQHPQQVLVGDGRRGTWTRLYGAPDPARILAQIDSLAAGRQAAATQEN